MTEDKPDNLQILPTQEKFFSTEKLRRTARAGTNLPDPTMAPFGYDPKQHYGHLFPKLELPRLFPPASHHPDDHVSFGSPNLEAHQLYLGDNLYVLRQLSTESIDLIYIDPPFFSNRTYTQIWGDDNEVRSFTDIFQDGMFSYLAWLNARLWEMKRVLKSTGSIYVHCDWHASHYIKCEMDKIFGYECFQNEIIWKRADAHNDARSQFPSITDSIIYYAKSKEYFFEPQYGAYQDRTLINWYQYLEFPDGTIRKMTKEERENQKIPSNARRFNTGDMSAPAGGGMAAINVKTGKPNGWYYYKDYEPPKRGWRYSPEKMEELDKQGLLLFPEKKNMRIMFKRYLDEQKGTTVSNLWSDIGLIRGATKESIGYPTQKPESLLERVILASTEKQQVVADFFMGGGSTGAVSLKLGRRFIGCDISRVAVSVTASRLIDIAETISGITVTTKAQPTLPMKQADTADIRIGYVGSYPQDKFRGISHEEFIKFILTIYQAMPFTGQAQWIHGLANNKIILSIGPGDPNERVTLAQVDGAVKDTVKQYSRQFAGGEDKILQIIGWSFDPQCEGWKRKAAETLNSKGVKLQIDLISLGSESFRQKIFRNVGESNLDLKFNRLNQLLSFTGAPFTGKIIITKRNKLTVSFALEGARAIGAGAKLINCQWDFSYDNNRFASREHALNRDGNNGDFTAILTAEYTFPKPGTYSIAARVQDNLDGQGTVAARIEVSETECRIIEEKIVNL